MGNPYLRHQAPLFFPFQNLLQNIRSPSHEFAVRLAAHVADAEYLPRQRAVASAHDHPSRPEGPVKGAVGVSLLRRGGCAASGPAAVHILLAREGPPRRCCTAFAEDLVFH
jgi:hypothetical protein